LFPDSGELLSFVECGEVPGAVDVCCRPGFGVGVRQEGLSFQSLKAIAAPKELALIFA
jgi:hypothetical protein